MYSKIKLCVRDMWVCCATCGANDCRVSVRQKHHACYRKRTPPIQHSLGHGQPRHELSQGCCNVGVGAPSRRDVYRKLCVAKRRQEGRNAGHDVADDHAGAGDVGGHVAGGDKHAGAFILGG